MRIATKLLVLLLFIALVPLGAATYLTSRSVARLGAQLAGEVEATSIRQAERLMLHTIRELGELMLAEQRSLRLALQTVATAAERTLIHGPAGDQPIYLANEFEAGGDAPGLEIASRQRRRINGADYKMMPISRTAQSVFAVEAVELSAVRDEILRLQGALPAMKLAYAQLDHLVAWQYVALESGIHIAFPGHGYYPANYDPRVRDWYKRAELERQPGWTPPFVDATSGRMIITLSAPLLGPDERFLGVAGLDVAVDDLVGRVRLPENWSRNGDVQIVVPRAVTALDLRELNILNRTPVGDGMPIIARQGLEAGERWDVPPDLETVQPTADEVFAEVLTDLQRTQPAVRRVVCDGHQELWGYITLSPNRAALLARVPADVITAPAEAAKQAVLAQLQAQRTQALTLFGGVVVIVLILSFIGARQVTRPLEALSLAAERIAEGDFETRTIIETHDEIQTVGDAMNNMLPRLREQIRLKRSLAVAMEVQQSLLPKESPIIDGLEAAGASVYCDETGGDYYDFMMFDEPTPGNLGVAIADVTGHGVGSALLMASVRAGLRSHAGQTEDLGALLSRINREIAADSPDDKFITLGYLVFSPQAHTIHWAMAGHDPPLVYDPAADQAWELDVGGIPLGLEEDWVFEQRGPEPYTPGQIFVLGTDGIWEARNEANDMFEKRRLIDVIRQHHQRSAEEICAAVLEAIRAFRGRRSQDDDITLVVIKTLPVAV